MSENVAALRDQLTAVCAEIADRLKKVTARDEIDSLNKTLTTLQTQLDLATLGALDNATGAIAQAAEAMRNVVANAQSDPRQQFVDSMNQHIVKLDDMVPGATVPASPPSDQANHQVLIDALDAANVTNR